MSLKTELQAAIDYCNTKLTAKGADTASTVYGIGDKIESITSGGNEEWVEALSSLTLSDNYSYGSNLTINLPDYVTSLASLFNRLRTNSNRAVIINQSSSAQANITSLNNTFSNSYFGDITLNIDSSHITTFESAFYVTNPTNIYGTPLDFSSVSAARGVQGIFYGCYRLQEVRFAPETLSYSISLSNSSVLSDDSVISIIGGLKTNVSGTITFHADVKARITGGQISGITEASITSKGWTLA